jgi:hypothetical protein
MKIFLFTKLSNNKKASPSSLSAAVITRFNKKSENEIEERHKI